MSKMKTITVHYPEFTARYYGVAYIDLFDNKSGPRANPVPVPYDCINVYDYEQSKPTIEFTEEAVRAVIADLMQEGDDRVCNVAQYRW